jgi:hypothetical protein
MELHITEIDNLQTNYEQIPENMPPKASAPKINVVKQNNKVRFVDQPNIPSQNHSQIPNQNIKPYMSGPKAKMVRPTVPPTKPQISYDDILNKLGMFVANGKLHLLDGQQQIPQKSVSNRAEVPKPHGSNPNPNQNTYIYNKYFQNNQYDQDQGIEQRPMTPLEYRDMLIKNIIQKHKIKQMKSTKLVMPNSNINFASGPTSNLNKLFGFSQR